MARTQNVVFRRDVAALIFLTLLGCYAYFWQARCWNSASRLMLTYALGDSATVSIDGLESQTRDRAYIDGHYYCDKPPGQSFLGLPFYAIAKLFGARHPLGQPPFPYWWPDYLLTICTSGVLTAALAVVLYSMALGLDCRQGAATLSALAYGLGTPAFTYATLFYGHQSAAFCAFAAFYVLHRNHQCSRWSKPSMFAAGLLAGYAVVAEYPLIVVSFGLLVYALCGCRRVPGVLSFCLGAAICAALLATYHAVAFGSPLQLGYFSETEAPFREIYSETNPLGLQWPSASAAFQILFSTHGLFLFAPVTLAAIAGIVLLAKRRQWGLLLVVLWSFGSLYLVNASHPTWTGGYATGPRYILPAVPFLMIAVAAVLALDRPWLWRSVAVLALAGFVIVGSCTAYGARLPDLGMPGGHNPLIESVLPAWRQGLFDRNLGKLLLYPWWDRISPQWKWVAFVPLLVFLAAMLGLLARRCAEKQEHRRCGS